MWRAPRIVFLCSTHGSLSPLAHHLAQETFGALAEIESAGIHAYGEHPMVGQVLEKLGYGHEPLAPRTLADVSPFADVVVSLGPRDYCPVAASHAARELWPLTDPGALAGDPTEILAAYEDLASELRRRLRQMGEARGMLPTREF